MVRNPYSGHSLIHSLMLPGTKKSKDEQSSLMASSKPLKVSAIPQHTLIGFWAKEIENLSGLV